MSQVSHKEVFTAIRSALNVVGVTALVANANVYRGKPPRNAPIPHIRMQVQADARDISTIGTRVYQYYTVAIFAVAAKASTADDISKAIDLVLERGSLSIGSGQHGATVRVAQPCYEEDSPDGNTYTHSGGIYEIGVKVT